MAVNHVFGLEGGGTSCRLRVETLEGELVGEATGGPLNPRSQAEEQLALTLAHVYGALPSEARNVSRLTSGFVGCAGADRAPEQQLLERVLRRAWHFDGRLGLGNDAQIVLEGALPEGEPVVGTVLIAGTGSFAWSLSGSGVVSRCGGYGHLLGDEGSAWWLASQGLRRSLRQFERSGTSPLLGAFLEHWQLASPQDLIPHVYNAFDKSRVAQGARVVEALRVAGDALAVQLFAEAVSDLVTLAVSARRSMVDPSPTLVLHGGLIEGNLWLAQQLRHALTAEAFAIVGPGVDAAAGACRLARRQNPTEAPTNARPVINHV